MSPWIAALFGFSLYASAGVGEILRTAILAIPRGQTDAGRRIFERIYLSKGKIKASRPDTLPA